MKCWNGYITSWNQDCRKKYQQPHICRWYSPNGRKQRTKEPLDKGKEESEKTGLKLNIQKTKIMASGLITSWQIYGETVETVRDSIFLGSKITADGDCSHEIKTLLPWKKSYDKPRQHIKSPDLTLLTEVHLVKAVVFPVVMYSFESWTMKNADCQRIDAFELWCWRRLLRVLGGILKEINHEYSLEGLMLKLKLQYFGHPMWRAN